MNETKFRDWLEANYRPNTVSTKLSEARQLAKAYGDLDGLYDEDQLDSVMESLRYSAADKAQDRPNPSKVPLTSDLYRDLSNLRTTINYYRRYRGEDARPRPDREAVDKAIDECAAIGLDAFLSAYGFGKDIDYWVVRDDARYPSKAVFGVAHQFMRSGAPVDGRNCNGTVARLHLEKLGFEVIEGEKAATSVGGSSFLLFDAAGAAFKPVRHGDRATGRSVFKVKPPGASNRADEAIEFETIEEVARSMLIDGLPARVQSVNGGQVNYIGYGKQKLVRYELDPAIARQIGVPPAGSVGQTPPLDAFSSTLQQEIRKVSNPVNLILYGPPGTGKTWSTAEEAVKLCDGATPADRDALMTRYRELVEARRIDFVTFHQSYSYEEFVEGLRPFQNADSDDAGASGAGFSLRPDDGLFRRISQRASASKGGGGQFEIGKRRLFKLSIGEAANPDDDYLFEEAISKGHALLGYGDINWSDARFENRDEIIAACRDYDQNHPDEDQRPPTPQSGRVQCPMIFRNWVSVGDLIVVSKGNHKFRAIGEVTGDYEYAPRPTRVYSHRRKVNWLWVDRMGAPVDDILVEKSFSMRAIYEFARADVNMPALEGYIQSQLPGAGPAEPEPYVLVIDEINRGNISKIFGELITLIEPDKRAGMPNAIEVRLPYSKQPFSVPANLHIIGTMNTADRSIALLDTALRRRFVFREVSPDPLLLPEDVAGVPLRTVLETINDRIEYLIDREHRIGHAFFMGDGGKDRNAIDATMRDKVIPLLQEYFFEDWGRVAAVLGERPGKGGGFLDCRKLNDPTGQDGEARESWSVRGKFAPDAYQQLIGKPAVRSPDDAAESPLGEAAE